MISIFNLIYYYFPKTQRLHKKDELIRYRTSMMKRKKKGINKEIWLRYQFFKLTIAKFG